MNFKDGIGFCQSDWGRLKVFFLWWRFYALGNVVFRLENIADVPKYRDVFFDFTFGFSDDVEADDKWKPCRNRAWLDMGIPARAVLAESAWTLLTRRSPRAVSGASKDRRSRPLQLPATLSELIGSKEYMPSRTPQGKRKISFVPTAPKLFGKRCSCRLFYAQIHLLPNRLWVWF